MTAPAPPPEAVTAAAKAIEQLADDRTWAATTLPEWLGWAHAYATAAVAAAAPVIRAQAAAAERERIRLGLGDDEMLLITVQEVLDLLEAGDA